jgi:hypothetical protein
LVSVEKEEYGNEGDSLGDEKQEEKPANLLE